MYQFFPLYNLYRSEEEKEKSGKDVFIAGSLPCQNDTYVEDQRDSKEVEKAFYEQAKIIAPYVDFLYLDVSSITQEICKLDEREFVSDFNICNKAESMGKKLTFIRCHILKDLYF